MSPDSVTASRPADSRYAALEERVTRLEEELGDCMRLQDAFLQALVARGALDAARLAQARATPAAPSEWNGARIVARMDRTASGAAAAMSRAIW